MDKRKISETFVDEVSCKKIVAILNFKCPSHSHTMITYPPNKGIGLGESYMGKTLDC